ncbi:GspH/FimT family pseudopilin [Undibacterium sp.]|jgi:type IV fimbrial biogenesis protein FimT|uniref:GspH/FimT family pseudopilin n=1 Tax=Undibacterium sp. TaxID=1914977 RepID=UPI002B55307C|nr:GspH/FimT family pseudopilin [Undibacterium sp.]HTD02245.1 GspH/FimT family pseudopilin [Undibacterium sp.]
MDNLYHQQQRGVTFLEVIVVVAITGMLLMLAGPSFTGSTQRFRTLGRANELVRDLQFARAEAIKQGVPVTVCASTDGSTCSASSNAWNKGWLTYSNPTSSTTVAAGSIVRIQKGWTGTDTMTADNSVSAVTFSREGFTVGLPGTGTVTFTLHTNPANTAATQCVAIIKTGRVQVQSAGTGACT